MGDNVAGDYASLSGVEIVNTARTISYLNNGLKPGSMSIAASCGCPGLRELIGCDEEYVDPETDEAPWYSPDHPESVDFAGLFVTSFEGMSSTFTRESSASTGDGSVLGRGRFAGRELVWRGFLLGASCCGVAYGLRWLTRTLQGLNQCRDCQGEDLELLVCCPGVDTTDDYGGYDEGYGALSGIDVEAFRTLKNVGLVEGPTIVSERRTAGGCSGVAGGCGGSVIMEIEFTLLAAQPFFYKAEIPVYNSLPFEGQPIPVDPDIECPGSTDCAEEFVNPGGLELPPAGTYSVVGCLDSIDKPEHFSFLLSLPSTLWKTGDEVVPYIRIDVGPAPITFRMGIYSSFSGDACGELALSNPQCDALCSTLDICGIPGDTSLVIDGRTRRMSIICQDGSVFPGEKLTQGPWDWPTFRCENVCLVFTMGREAGSIPPILFPQALALSTVSVSLFPREV